MTIALSPREIQSRLRAGASVAEVAKEAGVEVDRISGFALPVMAERAHVTRTALGASVRRRGDGSGHRRLGDLIHERLQARGLDADVVEWDSWRQSDLRWRLVGLLDDQAASRCAEFVYDTKGRFSVADNADARWMIGEELPRVANDPDNENTIDFHDEFALVRAISDDAPSDSPTLGRPGDDVPRVDSPYEGSAHTSELDELYDMLSGVSEDSVRIYLGLEDADDENEPASAVDDETTGSTNDATTDTGPDAPPSEVAAEGNESVTSEDGSDEPREDDLEDSQERASGTPGTDSDVAGTEASTREAVDQPETRLAEELSEHPDLSTGSADETVGSVEAPSQGATEIKPAASASPVTPEQDPLIQEAPPTSPPKRTPAKKRASIPSWDEIMFGGPSRS